MLSYPRPEYISSLASEVPIAFDLQSGAYKHLKKNSNLKNLREEATKPLKPIGQHSGTSMGFFDQGIITGLVAFVLPSLALLGYGGYRLVRIATTYYSS